MPSPQARYWMLTIPHPDFTEYLPPGVSWIKGQVEQGEGGYLHWQLVCAFPKKVRLSGVKAIFGTTVHAEPTRSDAAEEYVWKEATAVLGTRFELGTKAMKRNSDLDWESVWTAAKVGDMMAIPADVRIRSYHTLKRIKQDYMEPVADLNTVCGVWYYGVPGSGKSHSARVNFPLSFLKPCNKWWDGYREQENVLIDDFDMNHKVLGHHLKIWADKYSFIGEMKGGSVAIRPKRIVVTSNYSIEQIFAGDEQLVEALKRRFICTRFLNPFNVNLG